MAAEAIVIPEGAGQQAPKLAGLRLDGKRALVTGGSKGIGAVTAQLLLDLGAEVVICARSAEGLAAAKDGMKGSERCHVLSADLSTEAGVEAAAEGYPFDTCDILVNNAGINIRSKAEDFTEEQFNAVFSTNFLSVYRLSKAMLPKLQKAQGAAVVNISSVASSVHIPSGCAYGAAKAAMDQLTRNLAAEWARFGIRVNAVAPGPVWTPLVRGADPVYLEEFRRRIPAARLGEPSEVADVIAFLASDASSYVSGQVLAVDGGFLATAFNEVPGFWEGAM